MSKNKIEQGTKQPQQISSVSGELSDTELNKVAGGKPNVSELVITKPTNTASTKLFTD